MHDVLIASAIAALIASVAGNIYLFIKCKKQQQKKEYTVEAKELLANILSGPALIKISVIDKGDFFLRSPRDSQ